MTGERKKRRKRTGFLLSKNIYQGGCILLESFQTENHQEKISLLPLQAWGP